MQFVAEISHPRRGPVQQNTTVLTVPFNVCWDGFCFLNFQNKINRLQLILHLRATAAQSV
jgi:hypothetical protein